MSSNNTNNNESKKANEPNNNRNSPNGPNVTMHTRLYTGGAFMSPWIVREVISFCKGEYIAVIDMHRSQMRICHLFLIKRSQMKAPVMGTYAMIETMVPVHTVCNVAFLDDTIEDNEDRKLGIIINTCDFVKETGRQVQVTQRAHELIDMHDIDAKIELVKLVLDIVDLNLSGNAMFGPGCPKQISALRDQLRQVRANIVVKYNMQISCDSP